eukprot:3933334-Rhodomonas_salina.3
MLLRTRSTDRAYGPTSTKAASEEPSLYFAVFDYALHGTAQAHRDTDRPTDRHTHTDINTNIDTQTQTLPSRCPVLA